MQEFTSRLKTEGALLNRSNEVDLQKYAEQLKSELEEISKLIARKSKPKKEEESPQLHPTKILVEHESISHKNKSVISQLEESISRKSRDQERQNRRNFIYQAQGAREDEEQSSQSKNKQENLNKLEYVKSRYSETMSTASSHFKVKDRDQNASIEISDFILGKKLGAGKFGEVFVAQHRKTGFICALKRINRCNLDEKMMTQLCREIKIQSFLNHPNIVKLYTFFSDEKAIYLVQQLCISGQLYSLLKKKKKLPEELTKNIIHQICRALDYMHECQIIHRDLKPQNIIFHKGMIKICDFGWSISSKAMRQTFCGTPLYVSPELLKRKSYNNKIDVWSVGVLTYELLFGRVPFQIVTEKDFIKIIQDQIKFSKAMSVSEEAKQFVKSCLSKDPRDRQTIPELLQHPFLTTLQNGSVTDLY